MKNLTARHETSSDDEMALIYIPIAFFSRRGDIEEDAETTVRICLQFLSGLRETSSQY